MKTYEHQAMLPHLPVPALEDTLRGYLRSLEPLVTAEELASTTALVKDFMKPGGRGQHLQSVLLQRAKDKANWLAEWWEYAAYLSDPTPNALFVNMVTGVGPFEDFAQPVPQARRAAETVRYACEYLELLQSEQIPPETSGGWPLCMNMYRRTFAACRIPELPPADRIRREDPNTVRHIVVFCGGRNFVLDVFGPDGQLLTISDLEVQLLHVLQHSKHLDALPATEGGMPYQSVGALTALRRDEWTLARKRLAAFDSENARNLDKIESSLFALCLDSSTPDSPSELARQLVGANASNRWFDKSFQCIVFANGMLGANLEHANADATVLQPLLQWIGERCRNRGDGSNAFIQSRHYSLDFLPPPELLRWHLPDEIARSTIPKALEQFNRDGDSLRMVVVRNETYTRSKLRSVRLSSDIFVQMAIQLAGFRVFGRAVPTYESAHTRKYLEGRTETIRTVTNEVVAWAQAMQNPSIDDRRAFEKLQTAMRRHKELSGAALMGKGVDRHLLGLQLAASTTQTPDSSPLRLFSDVSYLKSGGGGNFVLSTSNISGYPWVWGGFVPMLPHGIGVCYACEKSFLGLMITSFDPTERDLRLPGPPGPVLPRITAPQFQAALYQAFDDIYALAAKYGQRDPATAKI